MSTKIVYRLARNGEINEENHYNQRHDALIAAAELWKMIKGEIKVYAYCEYSCDDLTPEQERKYMWAERTITIEGRFQ